MAYVRKTKDEFNIMGDYGYGDGFETVTTEETRDEAKERLKEYRENERSVPFKIVKKRVKIEPATDKK